MVDIQTVSILVTSAGLLIAALYYALQIRHQTKIRQTDLLVRLCSTVGTKEWMEAWGNVCAYDMKTINFEKVWMENRFVDYNIMVVFFEELGILVQKKLLDMDLVENPLHGYVETMWERLKPPTMECRKVMNDPRLGANWEYLYHEFRKREQVGVKNG
jgi:hypothetical protein